MSEKNVCSCEGELSCTPWFEMRQHIINTNVYIFAKV